MMLENLLSFLRRSFGQIGASGEAARNRLQLVLVHDRSGLSNENLELMKNDLLEVISKYLTIDQQSLEVEIQRSGDSVVLVTNIQIASIDRGSNSTNNRTNEITGEETTTTDQEAQFEDVPIPAKTSK